MAFDTVDRSVQLERLSHGLASGIAVLAWIASYLRSRTFSVSTNDSVSGAFPISYGVLRNPYWVNLLCLLHTTSLEPSCSG